MNPLTKADVERLLRSPSADTRAEIAGRVAALWRNRELAPNELRLADEIIRRLTRDVDVRVRKTLAETLKADPRLPHDVAMTLVNDLDEVAVPVLNTSLVFSEADLIEVIRTRSETCQLAVASRVRVPAGVADALVETGNEAVAATLMRNEGAEIDEPVGAKVLDIYSGSELVMDAMAHRRHVPIRLTERLAGIVAESLRRRLRRDGNLTADRVDELVDNCRERSLVDMVDGQSSDAELLELGDQLVRQQRVTPSLLLRALCLGKMPFFEATMARVADIDLSSARDLVQDTGKHGLRALCATANMPEVVYDVGRFAVRVGYLRPEASAEARRRFRLAIGAQFGQETEAMDDEALLRHLLGLPSRPTAPEDQNSLRVVSG